MHALIEHAAPVNCKSRPHSYMCCCRDEDMTALRQFLEQKHWRLPSPEMQKDGYLGNHVGLLAYMSSSVPEKKTMSPKEIRDWFKEHVASFPVSYLEAGFPLDSCQFDHIQPKSMGGIDHPLNYFILPPTVNQHWGARWTGQMRAYIGRQNYEQFIRFVHWSRKESENCGVNYNSFKPDCKL